MTPLTILTIKEHTHYSSARNHKLIRAAYGRGLTNVTITRYKSDCSAPGPGWWLKCDEYERPLFIGYQVPEAEARINRISYTPGLATKPIPLPKI